ncbi:unnamed protein product (macronuclear) [Paramecium tetraurelia]|uniref:Transmembrane protein n=1 Tax=Paramecium tetraurelia TaxID=5888 RepID=A0D5J1_PARTE|nr:uncharacterized protein GSPATT00013738001 [Paramecium tetraurelia]CAK78308.1 unnamed protein product [Paramecium tetraurelia]|eukprot:XP_001445705.1 hypothetical protein (macronuclear) [Paramecium tetraurelia strain d4-2]
MDIDAHNAEINELNDAKIQQIKASRKLFGGIIKKGDPLYKNIINVILFALLFPCMIIFELVIGIKNLLIYTWESLISLIHFIAQTYKSTKQYIIVNFYFVKNWIYQKGLLFIVKLQYVLRVCSQYITKKWQQLVLFIIQYFLIFIENYLFVLYIWIAKKIKVVTAICKNYYQRISSVIKRQGKKGMKFAISKIKYILNKTKQLILIIYKAIKRFTLYLKEKITFLITYLYQQIKKASIFIYQRTLIPLKNKIVQFSYYLQDQSTLGMVKLKSALTHYVPIILYYIKAKYLQFQNWILVQIKLVGRCLKYVKNRLIHYSLLLIDYLLGKYKQLKQNVISPFNLKVNEVLKKIKRLIIDISLKTIDLIKVALLFLRDDVIIKGKTKFMEYYRNGQKVSYQVFKILQKRGRNLALKLKLIYSKMRENSAKRYLKFCILMQKLQNKLKILANIIYQKAKILYQKILIIAKYIILKIKAAYKFIKKIIKLTGQKIKNFVIFLFRSIKKSIKWTIEQQCKILVKFILVFRIFKPIIWLTEKFFDIMFVILSFPYLQFNKVIEVGIDFFIYRIPNKSYIWIVYIIVKFIKLLIKIEGLLVLIFKQAKKIASIINSKLITPVLRFIMGCYRVIKKAVLAIVQSLINFKDMMKYNYVLPAWASIRLFGVKVKNSYIKIKQKVIRIIKYGIDKLKQACIFLKNQILFIKAKITEFFIYLIKVIKELVQLIWQQIKYVYGIMIDPLIQLKNQVVQVFISLKNTIVDFMQFLRGVIVAQCIVVKEAAQAIQIKMIGIFNQIKQSIIEQFQAAKVILQSIYDSIKQQLISIRIQIAQQMQQVKESLIQQKNAIAEQFRIVGQSIRMQGVQVKQSIITLKNDIKQTIQAMFKRN